MNGKIFVYVSYIRTTPGELWDALTSPEFTRDYWVENSVESDWQTGSPVRFVKPDGSSVLSGTVLASEKPRMLSYTWSYSGTEQARAEKPSRVTFLLERFEPNPDVVKLTVTHDEFPENTTVFKDISNGWPMVLSSLKTMLETKQAIHFTGTCGK